MQKMTNKSRRKYWKAYQKSQIRDFLQSLFQAENHQGVVDIAFDHKSVLFPNIYLAVVFYQMAQKPLTAEMKKRA